MLDISLYNQLYANDEHTSKYLYIKQNSFFDIILDSIIPDKILCSTLENPHNKHIIYNRIVINDLIPYYQLLNKIDDCNHIVVLLHEDISRLKKEDSMIILDKMKNANIINFNNKNILWSNKSISYAIPKPPKLDESKRNKHMLILGQPNRKIPEADFFIDFNSLRSYNDIVNLCEQYKSIIYQHPIDQMIAQSLGCQTAHYSGLDDAILNQTFDPPIKNNYDFASFASKLTKLIFQ